jgi:hypothetical protein
MEKSQFFHIASECVVIVGIVIYFNRQIAKLTDICVQNTEKCLALEGNINSLNEKCEILKNHISNLTGILSRQGLYNPISYINQIPSTQIPSTQLPHNNQTQIPSTQLPSTQIPSTQLPHNNQTQIPSTQLPSTQLPNHDRQLINQDDSNQQFDQNNKILSGKLLSLATENRNSSDLRHEFKELNELDSPNSSSCSRSAIIDLPENGDKIDSNINHLINQIIDNIELQDKKEQQLTKTSASEISNQNVPSIIPTKSAADSSIEFITPQAKLLKSKKSPV